MTPARLERLLKLLTIIAFELAAVIAIIMLGLLFSH